jgi:hypothetical protein
MTYEKRDITYGIVTPMYIIQVQHLIEDIGNRFVYFDLLVPTEKQSLDKVTINRCKHGILLHKPEVNIKMINSLLKCGVDLVKLHDVIMILWSVILLGEPAENTSKLLV